MASSEENKILFEEYSRTRSVELRNRLVENYLYMVELLARKYINKGVDYDDLYQVGSMALVFAVERFDPSKGFEFTSFATPTIIGEIKRYFRDKGWAVKVPRRLKEISARLPEARDTLTAKLGRSPMIAEIAEYVHCSEEEVLEAMESGQAYQAYSLQQAFDEDSDSSEAPVFEKYAASEDRAYKSFEDAELIKNTLAAFSEEEQKVFRMRFLQDKTQQEIAKELGVSQMTISRMEKKLREKFKQEYYK
ncbi:MAG: SigB/SigF/SigG family RNA polymerase sigma factor [Clostridiales bacterium]|nr:SigB/SigF/SigG family RNA polymerase sigma factor [Clostridiales bacterium]